MDFGGNPQPFCLIQPFQECALRGLPQQRLTFDKTETRSASFEAERFEAGILLTNSHESRFGLSLTAIHSKTPQPPHKPSLNWLGGLGCNE